MIRKNKYRKFLSFNKKEFDFLVKFCKNDWEKWGLLLGMMIVKKE